MKVIDDLYCKLVELGDFHTTDEDLYLEANKESLQLDGYIELSRIIVAILEQDYIQREQ